MDALSNSNYEGVMAKRKILIVDDEVDFLEMLKMRLEANDYEVVTASTGNEALSKAKSEKPIAVLLDILMPGIDGLEVLRQLRQSDSNLPIFILTAFSNEERFNQAKKLNASGFILKTSELQTEIEKISAAIGIAEKYKKAKL